MYKTRRWPKEREGVETQTIAVAPNDHNDEGWGSRRIFVSSSVLIQRNLNLKENLKWNVISALGSKMRNGSHVSSWDVAVALSG